MCVCVCARTCRPLETDFAIALRRRLEHNGLDGKSLSTLKNLGSENWPS